MTKNGVSVAWIEISKSRYAAGASFGTSSGTTNDYAYYLKPFVDEVNSSGGIGGRKLAISVIEYDPMYADDQQAACVNAAEDLKVFAALAGQMSTGEACLADKRVPTITYNSVSADRLYRQEKGWVRETTMNQDRLIKNLVDWQISSGALRAGARVGVLSLDNPEYKQVANDVLIPYLKSKGLTVAETVEFSSQSERAPVEAANAVLRFKGAGVGFVFPLLAWWHMYHFLLQAQTQGYKPVYTATAMGALSTDGMSSAFPPDQWNGTRAIAALRTGEHAAGRPDTPEQKECLSAFTSRGGKVASDADREFVLIACQQIHLFARVARLAGPSLTRQSFLSAIDSLGTYRERVVAVDTLTFRKGKYDGADRFAVIEWKKDCKCYHQVEGFRAGRW